MISAISNIIPQLISLGLIGVLSVFSFRIILRKQKLSYLTAFVWLMILSLFAYFLGNLLYIWDIQRKVIFFQLSAGLIMCFQFAYLALASFVYMEEPTTKKGKTLLRLPVIGFLLGYYLSDIQNMAIFAIVEILVTLMLAKKSHTRNYAYRAQLKALIPLPLIAMYSFPMSIWFAVYLAWSLHFKFTLANAAIVKNLMVDYDNSLHEE